MANAAIVQDGFKQEDPLSTLKLVTKPIPSPSPGHVVVHVKLRNIHIFDLHINGIANGNPGCEGYGIVHKVGEGVTKLQKGQRVIPILATTGNGSWQEYVCLDEEYVWPLPEGITNEQAEQFVINPWTAYSMLKELQPVPEGEYLIQRLVISFQRDPQVRLDFHHLLRQVNQLHSLMDPVLHLLLEPHHLLHYSLRT